MNFPPGGSGVVVVPGTMGKLTSASNLVETAGVTAPPQCEGKISIFKLKCLKPAKPDTSPASSPASLKVGKILKKKILSALPLLIILFMCMVKISELYQMLFSISRGLGKYLILKLV